MKFIMKLTLVLLIIGVILLAVGYGMGGYVSSPRYISLPWSSNTWGWFGSGVLQSGLNDWDDYWEDYDESFYDDWDGWADEDEAHMNTYNSTLPEEGETVSVLLMELDSGKIVIRSADENHPAYSVDAVSPYRVTTSYKDGTYRIRIRGRRAGMNNKTAYIYLPEDTVYDHANIEIGAASFKMDSIEANNLVLDVGMGTLKIDSITTNFCELEVGMGTATINTLDTQRADISIGMGTGDIGLTGAWEEYGYNISCGMGTARVNSAGLVNGLGESSRAGSRMLNADVGMGSLQFKTEQ